MYKELYHESRRSAVLGERIGEECYKEKPGKNLNNEGGLHWIRLRGNLDLLIGIQTQALRSAGRSCAVSKARTIGAYVFVRPLWHE
jgi:hypothetical protein